MLSYRILAPTTGDTSIDISLSMDRDIKNHDDLDSIAQNIEQKEINSIINNETEPYEPIFPYELEFQFWDGLTYSKEWTGAGFVYTASTINGDLSKNVFKKSQFLLEFYDNNTTSNNLLFNTTLSTYPTPTGKGCDITTIGSAVTLFTTYTITNPLNDIYFLYFNRDFNSLSNIKIDENDNKYVSVYMKAMFLNAKTGIVQYFCNSLTPVMNTQFNQSLYYFEIRFYENFQYSFFQNNSQVFTITLSEIIIK